MKHSHRDPVGKKPGTAAAALAAALDPEGRHPRLHPLLTAMPEDALRAVSALTLGYSKHELRVIAAEADRILTGRPGDADDEAGRLHHLAAIAPVAAAFGSDLPRATVRRYIEESLERLLQYWRCRAADLALSATNRVRFARGAALAYFVTEGAELPCWQNDALFVWIGSKAADLVVKADEITDAGRIDAVFLDSVSMDWVPNSAVCDDGSLDPAFYSLHEDRIDGFYGPPSVIPSPEWEAIESGRTVRGGLLFGELSISPEYAAVLEFFHGEVTEEMPFIATLARLAEGTDGVDGDDMALLAMDFDRETLAALDRAACYSPDERLVILAALDRGASVPGRAARARAQNLMRFVAATAPLLDEFICVDEVDEEDVRTIVAQIGEDGVEVQVCMEEALDFLNWVDEAHLWFEAAIAMEGYEVTRENHDDLARGLTAAHLIGCHMVEDSALETVLSIGRLSERIIFHSDELVISRDLSREGLAKLL